MLTIPLAESGDLIGEKDYESFLQEGDENYQWLVPEDEWQAICLNYTSGTTGNPKGVVFHHRGAYINALGNSLVFQLDSNSVYLWTLPMFHCNGWTFTWGGDRSIWYSRMPAKSGANSNISIDPRQWDHTLVWSSDCFEHACSRTRGTQDQI